MIAHSFGDTTVPMSHFRHWYLKHFSESKRDGSSDLDNFAIYFLNAMRQQTEHYLRSNENDQTFQTSIQAVQSVAAGCDTGGGNEKKNRCNTPRRAQDSAPPTPNFASTPEQRRNASAYFESSLGEDFPGNARGSRKNSSFAVSTPTQSLDRSRGYSFKSDSYTPIRRIQNSSRRSGNSSSLQALTPHSADKSVPVRNNSSSSNFCLGDFIVLHQSNSRSNRKKSSHTQVQNTAIASTGDSTSNSKPKKRVVPTTISHRAVASEVGDLKPFGCSSSFSNENNILKLTNAEIEDKNECSIMAARKSLKFNANEISKELEMNCVGDDEKNLRGMIERKLRDVAASKVESETVEAQLSKQLPPVELDKIKNRPHIQILADIYVVLMDLNFVTNILSEMAFVLNLLNAQEPRAVGVHQIGSVKSVNELLVEGDGELSMGMSMLNSVTSCIYFALCVLKRQRHLFAHLDAKSLGVVMHNERVYSLDMELKSYLVSIYEQKQSLLLGKSHTLDISAPIDRSFKSVYYQEDKDSRQHFVSNSEFGAFKTQRDLFYKVLKLWETHHLNPNWNFSQELAPRIREIFKQSENPINMAHFSKLFVSQLLISASDAASPEDIGVDVDAEKFSKLTQRLVAPSNFSVDYQFPRNQAFFRDFIIEAKSLPFGEQLRMALYSQLLNLNNSTFEQLNVLNDNKEADELEPQDDKGEINEFIVRPEVLASMIILAKFLGFVTAYPYSQSLHVANMSGNIEKKQLTLRSLFQPHFSVSQHLLEAIKGKKILITLPWLIQYLVMLDNVTLQLEDIVKATHMLYAVYTQIGFESAGTYLLSSTSIFILRCCLGWLFDTKPMIAENYFRYRASQRRTEDNSNEKYLQYRELSAGIFRIPEKDFRQASETNVSLSIQVSYNTSMPLNPVLESLLPVACPFLAEFRVAIMPSKYATTKYVSRTGRYRHITTRIAEPQLPATNSPSHAQCKATSNALNSQQSQQNKLIEAFLHSQNASMRRLIEFVTERIYKSVVKDGQHKFILPSKADADKRVNEITSTDIDEVFTKVTAIYESAHEDARQKWETNLPKVVDERIATALHALLPEQTTFVVEKTYSQLIRQKAMKRIQHWFQDNLQRSNLYCGDLNEIAQKISKANKKEQQVSSLSELKIVQLEPSVSDLLDELQYWLHCTSIRTDLLVTAEPDAITSFLRRIPEAFANTLPIIFYRLIGAGLVQITQHLIIYKPEWLTAELMSSVCTVWSHPNFQFVVSTVERSKRNLNQITAQIDNKGSDDDSNSNSSSLAVQRTPSIYDGLITVAFIEALGENGVPFGKLKDLLVYMIKKSVLTIDNVNVLFVPIFKENWPAAVLNEISKTLQCVADETGQVRRTKSAAATNNDDSSDDEAKSHLFMEVLADLSRDVDNFSFY
ncbi:PREDICTED: protein disks lost [Rhagoletis zephyria]|uniref:protein disks lost n=1 Tax=Rhagoletis zephyria TaxID=28612 RepID=UPI00081142E6|nr:PREDICTED: protein disks lost [Rhagoletis zephyria]